MTRLNLAKSCEDEVVSQLVELQRRATDHVRRGAVEDELFYAEQNARLVKNAEAYYRAMFLEEVSSWNLRDRHMAETLDALIMHLGRNDGRARIAVWVPFESVLAVPVVRPDPSRNVCCPFLSVVTVPVILPLASRNVVCADAAVASVSRITASSVTGFIGRIQAVAEPITSASFDCSVCLNYFHSRR
jgi:hypothetical protein